MFERPNEADEFKGTKKRHRPAPTPLNGMRFLSHGPIVRVEHNEARSVVETLSGLLDAIRVLSKGDRLNFVQAVAPRFVGHDAFRWLRCVSLFAPRHAGRDALCQSRRVMHRQPLRPLRPLP